jgi:hypothetical protein
MARLRGRQRQDRSAKEAVRAKRKVSQSGGLGGRFEQIKRTHTGVSRSGHMGGEEERGEHLFFAFVVVVAQFATN